MELQTINEKVAKSKGKVTLRHFKTESGTELSAIRIFYHSWGKLNSRADNVIWICHGLTADSNAAAWWPGLIGPGKTFDTNKYFIICPNTPGSCYGSSTPKELKSAADLPDTEKLKISARDIANMFDQMAAQLGIRQIVVLTGPSIGGFLALEWAIANTLPVKKLVLVATSYYASPWNIAINETQRMAINNQNKKEGLATARAIAMLSYRSAEAYNSTQQGKNKTNEFYAATYQQYQGEKLVKRFSPDAYEFMIDLFNSHDVSRKRADAHAALSKVNIPALVIGFTHDNLFPPREQHQLTEMIPDATLQMIASDFGHDAFLTESRKVSTIIKNKLNI